MPTQIYVCVVITVYWFDIANEYRYYKKHMRHVNFSDILPSRINFGFPSQIACSLFLVLYSTFSLSANLPSLLHSRSIFYLLRTLDQRQYSFLPFKAKNCFRFGLNFIHQVCFSCRRAYLYSLTILYGITKLLNSFSHTF